MPSRVSESAYPLPILVDLATGTVEERSRTSSQLKKLASQVPHTPLVLICETKEAADWAETLAELPVLGTVVAKPGDIGNEAIRASYQSLPPEAIELDHVNAVQGPIIDPVLATVPEEDETNRRLQQCWYRTADQRALALQARLIIRGFRPGWVEIVYVLIFLSVAGFELYAHFAETLPVLVFAYPAGMCLALLVLWRIKKGKLEENYVSYRTLAEGLRARFFLRILGTSVAQGRLMALHGHHMGWVNLALLGVDAYLAAHPIPRLNAEDRLARARFARDNWIEAQRQYFEGTNGQPGALERMRRSAHRAEKVARLLLFASAAVMVIWGCVTFSIEHGDPSFSTWEKAATSTVAMFLVVSAVIHSYSHRRGYESLAHRYDSMAQFFAHASKDMKEKVDALPDSPEKWAEIQRLACWVADMELLESGDWMLVQQERPTEVRAG